MIGRATAVLALAGSAAAFAPMMSMDMGRRQVVQTAGAAAVAAPLLRANPASAGMDKSARAPVGESESSKFLQQVISYQAKGIDGPYTGVGKK
jgi:hypothetical protein